MKVSAQCKARAKHTETKGPAQKWPVTDLLRARWTGRASAVEAAPGPCRTGRAKAVDAATGLQERDWPLWPIRLWARMTGRAIDAYTAPGPKRGDEPSTRGSVSATAGRATWRLRLNATACAQPGDHPAANASNRRSHDRYASPAASSRLAAIASCRRTHKRHASSASRGR